MEPAIEAQWFNRIAPLIVLWISLRRNVISVWCTSVHELDSTHLTVCRRKPSHMMSVKFSHKRSRTDRKYQITIHEPDDKLKFFTWPFSHRFITWCEQNMHMQCPVMKKRLVFFQLYYLEHTKNVRGGRNGEDLRFLLSSILTVQKKLFEQKRSFSGDPLILAFPTSNWAVISDSHPRTGKMITWSSANRFIAQASC